MFIIDQKLVILVSLFFAFICAFFARKSNRNPFVWFLSGFFFGIFSLLTLSLLNYAKKNLSHKKRSNHLTGKPSNKTNNKPPVPPAFSTHYLWYYLNPEDKAIGPMSSKRLFEEYKKGLIGTETYLWHDEMENWKKSTEINEFKESFTKKPLLSQE